MKDITMKELTEIWLKYKERTIKNTSMMQYRRIIDKYINVFLGDYIVSTIEVIDVFEFIEQVKTNLSTKSLQDIIVVLKSILYYGNVIGCCHIPLKAIPTLKVKKKKVKVLSSQDIYVLENYLMSHIDNKNVGLLICMYTGIRLGEICSLKWEDIILEDERIVINKTIYRINDSRGSHTEIGIPKTDNSIRDIPINHELCQILQAYPQKKGYVLTGTEHYLDPRSYQYYFKKIIKQLNLNDYNFHALRHTFATKCVQCEVDVKSLSEILGHSSVNTTLNIYVHSSFSIKKIQINKFELI